MTYDYVVICHSGAGRHSVAKEYIYKEVCKNACLAARIILKDKDAVIPDIVQAAVDAVKILEDDPCTNAGYGSNLTISGKIQCDASIMCGQSLRFGAVGCLSNIKNPIVVAEKLLTLQLQGPLLSGGRYPPSILVGKDATDWAVSNGVEYVNDSQLITADRLKKFKQCESLLPVPEKLKKRKLSEENRDVSKISKLDERLQTNNYDENLDTVGVIIADSLGRVVSASSSGGILLKCDGRIGQSCMFGSGCYSEQKDDKVSVTAVTTGLGEQLMRTMLPLKACEFLTNLSFNDDENVYEKFQLFLERNFMKSGFVSGDLEKSFGILCLKTEKISENKVSIDLLYGHSTPSMCFGYLSSLEKIPQTIMSRKPGSETAFVIGSMGSMFNR